MSETRMIRRTLHRRLWSGIVAGCCLLAAAHAHAQQPQQIRMHSILANQLEYLDAWLVGGRVRVTTEDPTRAMDSSSAEGDRQERLAISAAGGEITLNYRFTTPQAQFTIDVVQANQLTMRWQPDAADQPAPLELNQPASGPLMLRVGPEGQRQEWRGSTLWHLMIAAPQVARERVIPMIEAIRPDWRLADQLGAVEDALERTGRTARRIDRSAILALIAQLGSPRYGERLAAERQLRQRGVELVPVLRSLDSAQLDREQEFRLRQIAESIMGIDEEDTPERVATWLAGDPWIWYHLLARDDLELRSVAKDQLERLLETPIDFDPGADAATRDAKWQALRQRMPPMGDF